MTPRGGRQACPRCGEPVVVDGGPGDAARAEPARAAEPHPGVHAAGPADVPVFQPGAGTAPRGAGAPRAAAGGGPAASAWDELGFFTLVWAVLSSPEHTLQRASTLPLGTARRFAWTCALWGTVGTLAYRLFVGMERARTAVDGCAARAWLEHQENLQPWRVAGLVLAPFTAWLLVRAWTGVVALAVEAMGAEVPGERLRAAMALCLAPLCLALLPVVPWSLGVSWSLVLTWRGLREVARLPEALAMGVAALPGAAWLGLSVVEWAGVLVRCGGGGA